MSERCKYAAHATANAEAMTSRMAATFTGIPLKAIERHRAGKCVCTPTEQGTK